MIQISLILLSLMNFPLRWRHAYLRRVHRHVLIQVVESILEVVRSILDFYSAGWVYHPCLRWIVFVLRVDLLAVRWKALLHLCLFVGKNFSSQGPSSFAHNLFKQHCYLLTDPQWSRQYVRGRNLRAMCSADRSLSLRWVRWDPCDQRDHASKIKKIKKTCLERGNTHNFYVVP